ncbi:MAG: cytochrome C oxidase subunit IV family protein [Chitinophagaceae bacterium]|nr:cytochrome C oxidase subunit IV family protein [Chitinophagaceae bacterium]
MSDHGVTSPEISFAPEHASGTKRIWRTFWLLSLITVIELAIGLAIYNIHKGANPNATLVLFFKGMVCILTLAKAYYIVSIFMHLGDEIRNMIMTIVVPLMLFIWFITAFLWDGNAWKNLRNTNAGSRPAQTEQHQQHPVEKDAKP